MKNIFKKIVSKTALKPELTKVFIDKENLVATDSFSLVEVKKAILKDGDKLTVDLLEKRFQDPIFLKPEELDLEPKLIDVMPVEGAINFPNYKDVIPSMYKLESDKYSMITLDPNRLINLLQSVLSSYGNGKKYATIRMYVPKEVTAPLVVKRGKDEGMVGLLMQMNKES